MFLDKLIDIEPLRITNENECEIVGFTGHRKSVTQTVETSLEIGALKLATPHKFAVVEPDWFPLLHFIGL